MFGIVIIMLAPDLWQIGTDKGIDGLMIAAQVVFITGFALLALGAVMAVISCILYIVKYPGVMSESAPAAQKDAPADGEEK